MLFADDSQADTRRVAKDDMEQLDDVTGSGIFDDPGTVTVHANDGVFADHPSMPGYIERHPPFQLQDEVTRGGRPSMEVPGGGVAFVSFVKKPWPAPMQYPVLPVTSIYPTGVGIQQPNSARPFRPNAADYQIAPAPGARWSNQKQFIGDPTLPAASATPPAPLGLGTYLFAGLTIGVGVALVSHAVSMDNRGGKMTPNRRRSHRRARRAR